MENIERSVVNDSNRTPSAMLEDMACLFSTSPVEVRPDSSGLASLGDLEDVAGGGEVKRRIQLASDRAGVVMHHLHERRRTRRYRDARLPYLTVSRFALVHLGLRCARDPLESCPAVICPLDTARSAAVDEHCGGRLSTATAGCHLSALSPGGPMTGHAVSYDLLRSDRLRAEAGAGGAS